MRIQFETSQSTACVFNLKPRNPPHALSVTTTYTRSDGVKVTYDKEGFPDFTPHRHPTVKDVQIEFTGNYDKDFAAADEAAGITEELRELQKYTWHHHQDGKTMQLIRRDVHADFFHTGGMARVRKEHGKCE